MVDANIYIMCALQFLTNIVRVVVARYRIVRIKKFSQFHIMYVRLFSRIRYYNRKLGP